MFEIKKGGQSIFSGRSFMRLNNVFVVVISDENFDDFGLQTFDFLFDTTKKKQ